MWHARIGLSSCPVFEMRLLVFLLLGCLGVQSLKCRSQDGVSDAELKRIVRGCMQRGGNNNNNNNQDQDNDRRYGNGRYNFDNPYGQDYGPSSGSRQQQQQPYGNRWQRSLKQGDNNNNNNNNNTDLGACVAQCFFEEMNMVDGNGQPDRRKVSYLLTKELRDRELRNFYMDTVQQCFRYLENSRYNNNNSNNNKCSNSRELIKCMSEYAKAQCDDWEEFGNVLFN